MSELSCRVETAMLGWRVGEVVSIERTDYVDLMISSGRLTVVFDPATVGPPAPGVAPADQDPVVDVVEPPAEPVAVPRPRQR